ncbi:hypothetical protein [Nitratireductor sp. XY-223]|uniref:hypothetical protein n=1 Tax=Nitratireductor sp. XY-223 TaxID=2561926 RepID=UPI0010AB3331|nr:hypothetical protein [Nitratireductor sp. XY-223]
MTEEEDPFEVRKRLTFEQAEGAAPLPTQLKPKEITQELRAVLWRTVHVSLKSCRVSPRPGGYVYTLKDPWRRILLALHIYRDYRMDDDFVEDADEQIKSVRAIFEQGDYLAIFGWLQEVLRRDPPHRFPESIIRALTYSRAPYRVIAGKTIVPISSDTELETLKKAFADITAAEFHGARAHLHRAAELLTEGNWADSVRESIHSVESVARVLDGSGEFSKALARLENTVGIHGAMKEGFKKLYGYSSDEQGIRHPLLDDGAASVDEQDAMFMIGACASFVSYLINKARVAGLLSAT